MCEIIFLLENLLHWHFCTLMMREKKTSVSTMAMQLPTAVCLAYEKCAVQQQGNNECKSSALLRQNHISSACWCNCWHWLSKGIHQWAALFCILPSVWFWVLGNANAQLYVFGLIQMLEIYQRSFTWNASFAHSNFPRLKFLLIAWI